VSTINCFGAHAHKSELMDLNPSAFLDKLSFFMDELIERASLKKLAPSSPK
jgi:hypothetical protein